MTGNINGNPRHWRVESASNMLILLLLAAIVLNSVVVFAFQVWFVYDLDAPREALDAYSGSTILDSAQGEHFQSWLLRRADGSVQLVTVEKHVFMEKYHAVRGGTVQLSQLPSQKTAWGDAALVHISISGDSQFEGYHENSLSLQLVKNTPRIPLAFLIYSILLLTLEICGCLLFRKLRA